MLDRAPRAGMRGSVFAKLMAIMLAMAVTMFIIVTVFFLAIVLPSVGISMDVTEEFARVLVKTSPTFETAARLCERLPLKMRYEGPAGSWTTANDLQTVHDLWPVPAVPARERHRVLGGVDYYLLPAPDGGSYVFVWTLRGTWHAAHLVLLWLVLFLTVAVVWTAHTLLRRLLSPLRSLGDGVARLSEGQLDVVVANRTRDEFGLLTDGFNQMVRRVRDMVQARDQLLLDVSHELRSPVTRLKVALALLPDDERRAQMEADVAEMESMTAELLELERLRDGRGISLARQNLVPLLRDMAEAFANRSPGVRFAPASAEAWLDVDGEKLRTVLRNLLENAVKYSFPDSRAVELSLMEERDAIVIRVMDDGPGIPEQDVANLFEPFFRVDRSRSKKTGGYGLGLSICKRIVEAHGGTIAARNNTGRGASFIVTLPRRA
jgi:signal transduction histidine kinase